MTLVPARRGALAGGIAALILLAGCGGGTTSAPPSPAASDQVVTGTFIGRADDGRTAVAVVAEPAPAGGGERTVRGYLCDGIGGLKDWFPGRTAGNSASITSDSSRASFAVDLAATGATGTATLPDGRSLTFTAPQATGPAGLFDVTLNGTSATGTSTTGQKLAITLGGANGQQTTATVDGAPLRQAKLAPVEGYAENSTEALRVIVLPDGSAVGASKGRPSGSPGYTWSELDS